MPSGTAGSRYTDTIVWNLFLSLPGLCSPVCWLPFHPGFPHVVAKVTTISSHHPTGLAIPEGRHHLFPSGSHKSPQMHLDWTRLSHMAISQHQCSQKVASSAQPRSNGYLPHSDLLPGSRGGVVHQRKTGHWDPKAKDVMSPGHWETKAEDVLRKSCQSSCLDGGEDSDKRVPDGVIFELN